MPLDLRLLCYTTILTWVMLLLASMWRHRSHTPAGMKIALGNREHEPPPSPAAGRADRASKNMLENLILFSALLLAAHGANADQSRLDLGARIFFYARVVYLPIYIAGVPVLRTAVWGVSIIGLAIIAHATLSI